MNREQEKINSFEMAKKQIDLASKYLNVEPGLLERFRRFLYRRKSR